MIKIAHISDVHIRNLKYQQEYRKAFEDLYEQLREVKPDIIINTGDTAHTKTQLSPEYFALARDFIEECANIAPHIVILGNHDGNLKNKTRLDAVTPVVKSIKNKNLMFFPNSCETKFIAKDGTEVTFNVMSIFDNNWIQPSDPNALNIALYHGAVKGCKTDTGFVLAHADVDIEQFDPFDYVLLGDIHATNQSIDLDGRIRYPGSLIQQGFGETPDKGFLLWEIENKENFKVSHRKVYNPRPFISLILDDEGSFQKENIQPGSRLRLLAYNKLSSHKIDAAKNLATRMFNPEYVTFVDKSNGTSVSPTSVHNLEVRDLRDVAVQESLISEFLEDYNLDEETLAEIYKINKNLDQELTESDGVSLRNVRWNLEEMKWDNLFNYGENNSIDFKNLSGVIGLIGKNWSGKSSITSCLLFAIYNNIAKNYRKTFDLVNEHKNEASVSVKLRVGDERYVINRSCAKYEKKSKGEITIEAKTDVDYWKEYSNGVQENLNMEKVTDTNARIREVFGGMEDFLLTSMASQFGSLDFIDGGPAKRKEILGKFLDLELFEKKYKLAKEQASGLKSLLKKIDGDNYSLAKTEAELKLANAIKTLTECLGKKDSLEETYKETSKLVRDLEEEFKKVPTNILDIGSLRSREKEYSDKITSLKAKLDKDGELLYSLRQEQAELENLITGIDADALYKEKDVLAKYMKELSKANTKIDILKAKRKIQEDKAKHLEKVPCGDQFPECIFIMDAHKSAKKLNELLTNYEELIAVKEECEIQLDGFDEDELNKCIKEFETLEGRVKNLRLQVSNKELQISSSEKDIGNFSKKLQDVEKDIMKYEEDKEAIEEAKKLKEQLRDARVLEKSIKNEIDSLDKRITSCYIDEGKARQLLATVEEKIETRERYNKEYSVYQLYSKCMHQNGISFEIIKKNLSLLNQEIERTLKDIFSFQIFFEVDGNRLEIFLKHEGHGARPIEMASGAEKTIAALAIRMALLSVTSLPIGDIFIFDEPATSLDAENLEGFNRILEIIKSKYRIIILISHLEALKDSVDIVLPIDRNGRFANVII